MWILNRNKKDNPNFRSREHEVLFIDARNLGEMIDRRHKELKEEDIKKIAGTYHNWRNTASAQINLSRHNAKTKDLNRILNKQRNWSGHPAQINLSSLNEVKDLGVNLV